jgi:hypothetical protein
MTTHTEKLGGRLPLLDPLTLSAAQKEIYDRINLQSATDDGRLIGPFNPAMSDVGADPGEVACQIVRVAGPPKGERPFRVHVDSMGDGAEEVFNLGSRIRAGVLRADRLRRPPRPREQHMSTELDSRVQDEPPGLLGEPVPAHQEAPEARAIGLGCVVRSECLGSAIRVLQVRGIWGGMTGRERCGPRRAAWRCGGAGSGAVPRPGSG